MPNAPSPRRRQLCCPCPCQNRWEMVGVSHEVTIDQATSFYIGARNAVCMGREPSPPKRKRLQKRASREVVCNSPSSDSTGPGRATPSKQAPSLLVRKFLMNRSYLLVQVECLELVDVCLALAVWVAVEGVQRDLLPPRQLLFRDGLPRGGVEDIASLAGQPLQVVGYVRRRKVGRRIPSICLGLLLLPPRIKQLNCNNVSALLS